MGVAEGKVEKNKIEIVEVDSGKENEEDGVEVMPSETYTGALPCWHCGEASDVGDQVTKYNALRQSLNTDPASEDEWTKRCSVLEPQLGSIGSQWDITLVQV